MSRDPAHPGEACPGVVHESAGGTYVVALDDGSKVEASLRGRLKKTPRARGQIVIGDRVTVSRSQDAWTIDEVEERETELVRRGRGGRRPKVLAANLDCVLAVVALEAPRATRAVIDRLLVLIEASGMQPTLVLNKIDLAPGSDRVETLSSIYGAVGYEVLAVSAETGAGVDALREKVCRGSAALIGPSGVGKSSLLNALEPGLSLRIGDLSRKTGTGRHTTVGSRMIPLACGGLVADTPGFGDVGLWSVPPERVADCFPEFASPTARCRFRECTHLHEPSCGVREAVDDGVVAESRYASYRTLRAEAEEEAVRG